MANAGRMAKMAQVTNRRSINPFVQKLRDYLIGVKRDELPKEEWYYKENNRWANEQAAKTLPPPTLPGGVHHKLSANYYEERDGRRTVLPPENLIEQKLLQAQDETTPITKGPGQNFGLPAPTPGFGQILKRNRRDEDHHMRDKLAHLDKYDAYSDSK